MISKKNGSTLIENVIAISVLSIYVVTVVSLGGNLMMQQSINKDFIKMNNVLENTAEEILNKKYSEVTVATSNDTVDGFNRTIIVTEGSSLKEITITVSNSNGDMKLVVEKGQDIN